MNPITVAGGTGSSLSVPQLVFLSHTSDLGSDAESTSFVAAAVRAVIRARHAVVDMAYFAARDTAPAEVCVATVAQSDVYVGIIGLRYGAPVRDRPDVSYTELEFEAAGKHGRPRLIFLIRRDSPSLPRRRQSAEHRARQHAFRRRLMDAGLIVQQVASPAELELDLYQALVEVGPAPAGLARAQALLASLPTEELPSHAPLPPGPRMPIGPNPLFVGRGEELLQVAAALRGGDTTVALSQVVASTGLGGLGKTQLAVELVHRYGRFFAGGVFWLSFASAEEIYLQIAACAGSGAVGLEADLSSRPLEERVKLVMNAWQSAWPRLLVFDNCEEEALLEAWRPTSGGCRVLITSRRSQWSPTLGVTALALNLLPRPDSIELLRRYRPDLAADDPGLDAIAGELGDLPLALHLAGTHLRNYRSEVSLDDYLVELDRPELIKHASLLGEGLNNPSPTRHVQSLAQTFALCVDRLDLEHEVDQVAIALLARMAWMAPGEAVPRALLSKTLEEVGPLRRADGLRRLAAVGLVEEGEGSLRLHRLLAHFGRQEGLDPTARPAVAKALIGCGQDAYERHLTGSALAATIPHLVDVAGTAEWSAGNIRQAAELSIAAGRALLYAGDLKSAKPWYERALVIRQRVLGPDHLDTAEALDNLGILFWEKGELAAARPLYEQALAARQRMLGHDHPDVATSLHSLAVLLHDQGDLAAARAHCERALAIRQRILGVDHPHTAFSLNCLAATLRDEGELAAAQPLFEQALAIRERVLGPDHPDTAFTLHGMALLHHVQGELADARALCERALAIRERVLGPDHPDTAASLYGLAVILYAQGRTASAKWVAERVLDTSERVLGRDHPQTASSLNLLARLLHDEGELALAGPLAQRALAIRERVLGQYHPSTATSHHDLALLLWDRGELDVAKGHLNRAIEIRERVLGPNHQNTAATRATLRTWCAE